MLRVGDIVGEDGVKVNHIVSADTRTVILIVATPILVAIASAIIVKLINKK